MAAAAIWSVGYGCGVKNIQLSLPRKNTRSFFRRIYFSSASFKRSQHSLAENRRVFLKCAAENTTHTDEESGGNISRGILMWRAIKLPMYTVALIPLTVGSAAAYFQMGRFFGKRFLILLVSSVFVIAWINLSNDVYDFDTGADKNKKESVVNLFGSRTGPHIAAWMLLAIGFSGLGFVAAEAQSRLPILLLSFSILCGYVYQCPPFRLSYVGLGEPLCFAAFGPFATTAFYLLQSGMREVSVSSTIIASSFLVGLTTTLILFCSHFHQIDDDKVVGKFSPLVRLGTERGSQIVTISVAALYSPLLFLGLSQALPILSIVLCSLTLPVGISVANFVQENHKDKDKIFKAKYLCVRLHTIFGAALATGLVCARLFARKKLPHAILL